MGDRFYTNLRKRQAVDKAESDGLIADSIEVRIQILKDIESGKITPEEGQAQLKKIKRDAKKNGLLTRQQAFSRG